MEFLNLNGLTVAGILGMISNEGFTLDHALKISNAVYKKSVDSIDNIPDISGRLKNILKEKAVIDVLKPVRSEVSNDGTVKYLFVAPDGRKFETVYIPDRERHTVCVSAQSGCRMGCPFCVTGAYGFHGNLSSSEIVSQVTGLPVSSKINRIVFMGMGEPMDNLENVLKACEILSAEWGRAIGNRNITVSSVGITPGIREFLEKSGSNLAVSLFSPFAEERRKIVPVEKKYPVGEIIRLMKEYPAGRRRRMTLSYVMISGVNDSDAHLSELKKLLKGSSVRINLLPFHKGRDDTYHSSTAETMNHFRHELVMSGIQASIRRSRGSDISAACGLLASGLH